MNVGFETELQDKLNRLEKGIQSLISQLEAVKNENNLLRQELSGLRSSISQSESYVKEIERLKASRASAGAKIEALIKQINELPIT